MNIGMMPYAAARVNAADGDFNTLREVHMSDELYFGKQETAREPWTEEETAREMPAEEKQSAPAEPENAAEPVGDGDAPEPYAETAGAAPDMPGFLAAHVGKRVTVEYSAGGGPQSRSGVLQRAGADYIVIRQPENTLTVCGIAGVKAVTITE